MKVFTQEFVDGVSGVLATLKPNAYITRAQVCSELGIPETYANAISMLTLEPEFAKYEAVKSRGYRLKKDQLSEG